MTPAPKSIAAAELALRILACRGSTAFFVFLVSPGLVADTLDDLEAELRALDESLTVGQVATEGASRLLHNWPSRTEEVLLVDATAFTEDDFRLLDRRRSDLARTGLSVLMMSATGFDVLMRVAPNLASWLGGQVFTQEAPDDSQAAHVEHRLQALRSWSGKDDEGVLSEAEAGTLPRDPQYAEWLVLLGRGDLLDDG